MCARWMVADRGQTGSRLAHALKQSPSLVESSLSFIHGKSANKQIGDVRGHLDTRLPHPVKVSTHQIRPAMSDEHSEQRLERDSIGQARAVPATLRRRVRSDRVERRNSEVQIVEHASVAVDQRRPMRALNRDGSVLGELAKDALHLVRLNGLDGAKEVEQQLVRVCARLDTRSEHLVVVDERLLTIGNALDEELHHGVVRRHARLEGRIVFHELEHADSALLVADASAGIDDGTVRDAGGLDAEVERHLVEELQGSIGFARARQLRDDRVEQIGRRTHAETLRLVKQFLSNGSVVGGVTDSSDESGVSG